MQIQFLSLLTIIIVIFPLLSINDIFFVYSNMDSNQNYNRKLNNFLFDLMQKSTFIILFSKRQQNTVTTSNIYTSGSQKVEMQKFYFNESLMYTHHMNSINKFFSPHFIPESVRCIY